MRPRLTLYDEDGADDRAIEAVIQEDQTSPDVVFVVGTSFKIESVQDIVRQMHPYAEVVVWINKEAPPDVEGIKWDLIVLGDCDEVARGYEGAENESAISL